MTKQNVPKNFYATVRLDMDLVLNKPLKEVLEVFDTEIWAVRRAAIKKILEYRGEVNKYGQYFTLLKGRLAEEKQ